MIGAWPAPQLVMSQLIDDITRGRAFVARPAVFVCSYGWHELPPPGVPPETKFAPYFFLNIRVGGIA